MDRQTVKSSNLESIGYNPETQELEIKFHKTGIYVYKNVSESLYNQLMKSQSKGHFFATYIRNIHAVKRR